MTEGNTNSSESANEETNPSSSDENGSQSNSGTEETSSNSEQTDESASNTGGRRRYLEDHPSEDFTMDPANKVKIMN